MRKTVGLLCAAALLLPVGVITASPAAAAAGTVCSKASGTGVFTPAVPKGATTKKASKLTATGKVSGCTGSVRSGTTKFVQTSKPVPGNCQTLLVVSSADKPAVGTLTIKWNNGKTSTAKGFKIKQTKATEATTTGKITSGLFVGKVIKGTVTFKPKQGDCVNSDLKSVSYVNKSGTKFVIK
jgi:hypothetical protein